MHDLQMFSYLGGFDVYKDENGCSENICLYSDREAVVDSFH